jgi:CBS domain-containing protein
METLQDVMTPDPVVARPNESVRAVARRMRDEHIGDVLVVEEDGTLAGIVTDRDIVVRVIADGVEPDACAISDVLTPSPVTMKPASTLEEAVGAMREHAIRRLPVLDDDRPVGIVSIGDLAMQLDGQSALADISAAPPSTGS